MLKPESQKLSTPPTDGPDLGRSRGAGEWHSRMASTCGPMQSSGCGM